MILTKYEHIDCPKFQINHGLRKEFLDPVLDCNALNLRSGRASVCYLGNLQYRYIHLETITKIVNQNTNVDFYFIGPNGKSNFGVDQFFDYSELEEKQNTFFLGLIEGNKVASLLGCFDAFLICYESNDKSALSNLHKVLEYLSTGKVVVSTYSDQYKNKRNLLEMVDHIEEYPERFNSVINNLDLHNSSEKIEIRRRYAKENTYSKHIERIESIIMELFDERRD